MIQTIANALFSASAYLMVGLGFLLIYHTVRFFHFAHGAVLTIGAYATFTIMVWGGLPLPFSMLGGTIVGTLVGAAMEFGVYKPMRKKRASFTGMLIASLGIYIVLQSILAMIFGSGTQTFRGGHITDTFSCFGAHFTWPRIYLIITSLTCCILIWLFLRTTKIGKCIRAVANDPELAEVSGLNRDQVILVVFLVGSALASIAGIFFAWDADMTPTMGFRALLMGMIAVIIGGVGSLPGAALGALFLGLTQHLTAWWISTVWQDTGLFIILIVFLVLRPQGFIAKPSVKGRV